MDEVQSVTPLKNILDIIICVFVCLLSCVCFVIADHKTRQMKIQVDNTLMDYTIMDYTMMNYTMMVVRFIFSVRLLCLQPGGIFYHLLIIIIMAEINVTFLG